MQRALVGVGLALSLFSAAAREADAEPRDLSEQQSSRYYYLHAGLTAAAFLGTAAEEIVSSRHSPGYDLGRFGPDDSVRANFSGSSAHLSDKLLALNLTAPLLLQMSEGFGTRMGNATLVYAEAISFNVLATSTIKLIVRRPRPYTHSKDPRILDFMDRQGSDAYSSFYSGHASTAFTAATAGSLLYSLQTDELAARHTVWGMSFLLAGMTAQLRTRAGRHYRTDIWFGSFAGMAVGALVPTLHRLDVERVRGTELAVAGGALGVTLLLSEVVDFCAALDVLNLCGLPRDVDVPLRDAALRPRWVVLPQAFVGGGGVSVVGDL
jgi:membrane-associated phospholipid phosphatase